MNPILSSQRILLAAAALVVAWAPAAMIAMPGAEHASSFVVEAAAQDDLPAIPIEIDSARVRG